MTSRCLISNNGHVPTDRPNKVVTAKKRDLHFEKEKQEIIDKMLLTPQDVEEIRLAFELFDIYGSDSITKLELQKVAASVDKYLTDEDVAEIIAEVDQTGAKGEIDFNDFMKIMGNEFRIPLQETEIEHVFKTFDQNGDMFISPDDMHRTFLTLGIDLTTNELTSIFEEYDLDRDGMISLEGSRKSYSDILDAINSLGNRVEPEDSHFRIERLTSIRNFEENEESLKNNESRMVAVRQISRIGGADLKDNVRKVMRRLMDNVLMSEFNLSGNRGKRSFKNTNLFQVVVAGIMKSQNTTETAVAQCVADTLKRAPDRHRMSKAVEAQ